MNLVIRIVAIVIWTFCIFGFLGGSFVYRENLPPVFVDLVPAGVRLRFTGVPGHTYNIERALAVSGPWSIIATPTAPLNGVIDYLDVNLPVAGAFYRTSAP